jgi:tetratricopeptide (TPR) repeat protein
MLLRRFPYWSTGHEFISSHASAAGNLRAAFASAHALATLRPSAATPYILFARCHLAGQQFEAAAKNARKALELDPFNDAAKEELSAALISIGHFDEANQVLESISDYSRMSQVHSMKAFLSFQRQTREHSHLAPSRHPLPQPPRKDLTNS